MVVTPHSAVRYVLLVTLLVSAVGPATADLGSTTEPVTADRDSATEPVTADLDHAADTPGLRARATEVVETRTYRNPSAEPGVLHVTLAYDLPVSVNSITVEVENASRNRTTLVDATGFDRRGPGKYVSTRADSPALTFRVNVSSSRFGPPVGELRPSPAIDRGPWALLKVGSVVPVTVTTRPSARVTRVSAVDGDGIRKHGLAFLGSYRTHERVVDGRTYSLIVPRTAPLVSAPDMVLDAIENSSREFDVGAHNSEASFFVVPIAGVGTTALGAATNLPNAGRVWVRADSSIAAGQSGTWTHEYVHTRQAYQTGSTAEWTVEGSATYYGALLPLQQGRISYAKFQAAFSRRGYGPATLANPDSWKNVHFPYEKGSHVLAALDVRIRNATDGRATLETVFRRVNQHRGTVRYDDFRSIVASVASPAVADWLDPYVRGEQTPPPLPDDPFLYVSGPDRDPDGDGLANHVERRSGTHPFRADTDRDDLPDARELEGPTNATMKDTDEDGLADADEPESDPTVADTDGDGLSDADERSHRTAPRVADTDGDGLTDGREVAAGTNPNWADTDRDGLGDAREIALGTDPLRVDTDDDGLIDPRESGLGTDPTAGDTDGDGYGDSAEHRLGTDPATPTGTIAYWLALFDAVR